MKQNFPITFVVLLSVAVQSLQAPPKKNKKPASSPLSQSCSSSEIETLSPSTQLCPSLEPTKPSPLSTHQEKFRNVIKEMRETPLTSENGKAFYKKREGWKKPSTFTDILCIPGGRLIKKANAIEMEAAGNELGSNSSSPQPSPKEHYSKTIEACKSTKSIASLFYTFPLPIKEDIQHQKDDAFKTTQSETLVYKYYKIEQCNKPNNTHTLTYLFDGNVEDKQTLEGKDIRVVEYSANWFYPDSREVINPFYDAYYQGRFIQVTKYPRDLLNNLKNQKIAEDHNHYVTEYESKQALLCHLAFASELISKRVWNENSIVTHTKDIHEKNARYNAAKELRNKALQSITIPFTLPESQICPDIVCDDVSCHPEKDALTLASNLNDSSKEHLKKIIEQFNNPERSFPFTKEELSEPIEIIKQLWSHPGIEKQHPLELYIQKRNKYVLHPSSLIIIPPHEQRNIPFIEALITIRKNTRNNRIFVEENIRKCVTALNENFKTYLESQTLSAAVKESYKQPQIREFPKNSFVKNSEQDLLEASLNYVNYVIMRVRLITALQNNNAINPDMPSGDTVVQQAVETGEKVAIFANNTANTLAIGATHAANSFVAGTKSLCTTLSFSLFPEQKTEEEKNEVEVKVEKTEHSPTSQAPEEPFEMIAEQLN